MMLDEAVAALERADFAGALEALGAEPPDNDPDASQWFELRAQAAYGGLPYDDAVAAWEQLHRFHRSQGNQLDAARAAVMTAVMLLIDSGLMSAVRGWVRRAERLLDGDDLTPVHALVAAVRGYERFFSGDLGPAAEHAARAVELGESFDVMSAVVLGRTATGRIAVLEGDVDGGLEQLDEVAALLMSGDVDPLTTGMMYCELICAAQGLGRHERAREWTDVMERWCPDRAFGGIQGRCRVHRAELLRLSGPAEAAEHEVLRACAELRPWMRREFGWPLAELGMIRLRRGDLAGAEEAYVAATDHGWPVHPGLALLRLEQGDLTTAAELIGVAIAHPAEAPSKEQPPFGDLRLAPLLDAQAEIAATTQDGEALGAAAGGLARISERYGGPVLAATAELAAARASILEGDAPSAAARAREALAGFVALDARFDVGRAHTVLADALELCGDRDAARSELSAGLQAYLAYGATARAAALRARIDDTSARPAPTRERVRQGVLLADGPTWRIELDGERSRVKDLKGIRYLRRLIAESGREFHVLDLVAVENGTIPAVGGSAVGGEDGLTPQRGGAGMPALDDAARDSYRRRLAEVDDDIEEAERLNDLGRL
ncbi:MAG TPA: hypothetical protein VJM33_16845, partial [Microthrixaceae bacterium]|nr:hypothetical protein [Microthrixaceae bacterium]